MVTTPWRPMRLQADQPTILTDQYQDQVLPTMMGVNQVHQRSTAQPGK